jgi:hypothetical protein
MDGVAAVVAQLKDFGQPFPALSPSGEGSLLYSGRLAEGMQDTGLGGKVATAA